MLELPHPLVQRRERRPRLRRDDLDDTVPAERDQRVLGAAVGMLAADASLDARQTFELRDALGQAPDADDEMVELRAELRPQTFSA